MNAYSAIYCAYVGHAAHYISRETSTELYTTGNEEFARAYEVAKAGTKTYIKYTIKRLLQSCITVLIVVTIVFLLLRMLPTDYYFTEEH